MDLVLKQFDDILLHFTAERTIDGIDVAVTKQTRNHFGFSDPCGKTLEEYNKSAMLCCMTAAQRMNTPGFERVLAAQIFPCFTIGCWNQTKTVYDFDYEFQKMLMDTDDVAIHQDILQRLPVRDFFIPVYDSYDYNGMFVHVEFDEKEKTTAFGIVLVGPTKGSHDDFTFLTLPAWAKENQSLTEATRSTKEYLEKAAGQRQVNGISVPAVMEAVPSVFDGGTPYVRLAILCANYLASKNPDVRLETSKKRDRPVFVFQGKAQRINVKTYTVGENAAKEYKKNGEGNPPPLAALLVRQWPGTPGMQVYLLMAVRVNHGSPYLSGPDWVL